MPTALDAIVTELSEADRQERIDLLIDFAKSLPPLPERLAAHKDASHRVEECQSPVYLFVELDGDRVALYADAPIEAPTVRGFVSLLVEGLNGATVEEVLQVPDDLVERLRPARDPGHAPRPRPHRRAPAAQGRGDPRGDRTGRDAGRDPVTGARPPVRNTDTMADFVKVATRAELPPGGKKLAEVDGRPIAVFNVDGTFYAIDDVCTHDGGPLAEGELAGLRDPVPAARGPVRRPDRQGRSACRPFEPVATHAVEVRGDDVYVALSDD